jgi:hypothetical protein
LIYYHESLRAVEEEERVIVVNCRFQPCYALLSLFALASKNKIRWTDCCLAKKRSSALESRSHATTSLRRARHERIDCRFTSLHSSSSVSAVSQGTSLEHTLERLSSYLLFLNARHKLIYFRTTKSYYCILVVSIYTRIVGYINHQRVSTCNLS